ncbi:MAG: hypothetical protein IPM82_28995 [Saprospiraceae bacterium]|nr:hypothetical protein [Saprospiraceae bacterium]
MPDANKISISSRCIIVLEILHMEVPHEKQDQVLDIILQKEEEIENGFLVGLEPQQLDLENGDLHAVFSCLPLQGNRSGS